MATKQEMESEEGYHPGRPYILWTHKGYCDPEKKQTRTLMVYGSTVWRNRELVHKTLDQYLGSYPEYNWIIVHGGRLYGVDAFTHAYARQKGIPIHVYEANTREFSGFAGTKRNTAMVQHAQPHVAFLFRSSGHTSPGTEQCLRILGYHQSRIMTRLKRVFVVRSDGSMKLF